MMDNKADKQAREQLVCEVLDRYFYDRLARDENAADIAVYALDAIYEVGE